MVIGCCLQTLGGLRQLPSPPYGADSGVTLTLAKAAQSAAYATVEPHHAASEQLNNIASYIPIQAIFGTRVDYWYVALLHILTSTNTHSNKIHSPRAIQDNIRAVLEKSSNNQIEFIEDAGHTVCRDDRHAGIIGTDLSFFYPGCTRATDTLSPSIVWVYPERLFSDPKPIMSILIIHAYNIFPIIQVFVYYHSISVHIMDVVLFHVVNQYFMDILFITYLFGED